MVVESVSPGPPLSNCSAGHTTASARTASPASVTARRFMALRLGAVAPRAHQDAQIRGGGARGSLGIAGRPAIPSRRYDSLGKVARAVGLSSSRDSPAAPPVPSMW